MMSGGGAGGYAAMVSAGPSFATQDGAGRSFSPGGYSAATASGGQRQTNTNPSQRTMSSAVGGTKAGAAPKPTATPVMSGPMSAVRPGGYTPTYLKYGAITPHVQAAVATPMSIGAGRPNVPVSVTMPPTGTGPGSYGGMQSAPNTGVTALGSGPTSGPMNYWTQATGLTGNPASSSATNLAKQGLKPIEIPQAGPLFGGYYDAINNAMKSGIEGYANIVGQQFQQQIGKALGGINAIGGLRSGAVPAYINQAMIDFGNQVGSYADMAQQQVLQDALAANQDNINNLIDARDYTAKKRASEGLAPVIGSLTGLAGQLFLGMNNKGNGGQSGGQPTDPSSYLAMAGAYG